MATYTGSHNGVLADDWHQLYQLDELPKVGQLFYVVNLMPSIILPTHNPDFSFSL